MVSGAWKRAAFPGLLIWVHALQKLLWCLWQIKVHCSDLFVVTDQNTEAV